MERSKKLRRGGELGDYLGDMVFPIKFDALAALPVHGSDLSVEVHMFRIPFLLRILCSNVTTLCQMRVVDEKAKNSCVSRNMKEEDRFIRLNRSSFRIFPLLSGSIRSTMQSRLI